MVEDKRPKPVIDGTADPVEEESPKLEDASLQPPEERFLATPEPRDARRGSGGVFSHFMAAVLGAGVMAGLGYVALTGQVEGLSLADPATQASIAELRGKLQTLDSRVRAAGQATPVQQPAAGADVINDLKAKLGQLTEANQRLENNMQAALVRLRGAEQRLDDAQALKTAIDAEIAKAVPPLATQLNAVQGDVAKLKKMQEERIAEARSAALNIALSNLKRAVNDGRPFQGEMTAVANLTNAPLPILDLKPYQGAGIPDKAQLYTRFQATSKTALENFYRQLDQNAGLVSQIIARAQSAIHVKPADNSGNMPQAILARAENDVRGGQIAAALAELKALPEKIQQELKTWTEAAEARLKADQAFQKTDEMLLSMLSQPALR